jgi:hypothetical protein
MSSEISIYDKFIMIMWFLYELTLLDSHLGITTRTYDMLNELCEGLPLKWFIGQMDIVGFYNTTSFNKFFDNIALINRRESVEYTVKFRNDTLFDTNLLNQYIESFLEVENLDATNITNIANAIRSSTPSSIVKFSIPLKTSEQLSELDLLSLGLPPTFFASVDYHISLENFVIFHRDVCSMAPIFSYNKTGGNVKTIELDFYIQFKEAKKLIDAIDTQMSSAEQFRILNLIRSGSSKFTYKKQDTEKSYKILGVMSNKKSLETQRKASIHCEDMLIKQIDYKTSIQRSPRILIAYKLAKFILPKKDFTEFKKETSTGLYDHQVRFINAVLRMIHTNGELRSIIYSALVGSGKTTCIVSLAYALKDMNKVVIYTTWSKEVKKEVFIKAKEIGLRVASSFVSAGGRLLIKDASGDDKSAAISLDDLTRFDILICHPLTLLAQLATDEGDLIGRIGIVVLDEMNSGSTNSTPEHVLGALLSCGKWFPICVLSASIQKEKHIKYLTCFGRTKVIESNNILVPTYIRQMDGTPIDLFNWSKVNVHKVIKNTFLQRFVTEEVIRFNRDFIEEMMKIGIFDNAMMLAVAEFHKGVFQAMTPSRIEYSSELEIACIKSCKYFTLVSVVDPRTMAYSLYGNVLRSLENVLNRNMARAETILNSEKETIDWLMDKKFKANHKTDAVQAKMNKNDENLSPKELNISKLLKVKNKLLEDKKRFLIERALFCSEINILISNILVKAGIFHKYQVDITLDDFKTWKKSESEDFLWELLGVFVEGRNGIVKRQMNRIFAGEAYSRGIDFHIEVVIITRDFAESVSADTICQTTGRSGRPGKSNISIVYMDYLTYAKIYKSEFSNDVEKIMLRTNFYRQTSTQHSIIEEPLPVGVNRVDILLDSLKRF